jgi:hypothetical protein
VVAAGSVQERCRSCDERTVPPPEFVVGDDGRGSGV